MTNQVWFTADQHFGHKRIIELTGRPFSSVEEMNEVIIANHNKVVGTLDRVYHLGDFAMGNIQESLPLASRLNGIHTLIMGNHDRPSPMYPPKSPEVRLQWLARYKEYFDDVQEKFWLPLRAWNSPIAGEHEHAVEMYHLPYGSEDHMDGREAKLNPFRPKDEGRPLLHGHIHELRKFSEDRRQFNVGVDVNNFTPVSLDEVETWLRTL